VGSTNLSYQWQWNGASVPRANAATYTVSNAQAGAMGSYTVVVSNVVGVVTSAPPALLVLQFAPIVTRPPTNQTVLLGQKAAFSAAAAGVNTKANPFHFQWYGDGAPLAGAAASNLVFTAAQWTNQGSYQLVVSNSYGAATSAVAVLTVKDPTPPTVSITNPVNNSIVQTNQVTVGGTASDNAGVAVVRVQVNTNAYQTATGSNVWSLLVNLVPGTNLLTAQAVDVAGNTNLLPAKRNIIYRVSSRLTVITNGVGSVTSAGGATNGATLFLNQTYTLTAAVLPKTNWLFDHWSSGATNLGAANPLSFRMSSNLVLTANFVTNPFPAVAGTYNGLFYPAAGVEPSNAGFFSATLVSNGAGAYTAQLMLNGATYHNPSGLFTPSGQSQWNIPAAGGASVSVALNLHLDPVDGQLTGTVASGSWSANLQADLAPFNPVTRPATNYNGEFTLILPPGAGSPVTTPGGYGYAAISNSLGGVATIVGALADGTPFSQSVGLAQDGSIPLYATLYGGNGRGYGSLMGWLTFTNQPPKTLSGSVHWIKPRLAQTAYPNGFNLTLPDVLGSAYSNTPLDLPAPTLTLTNGNLPASNTLVYHLTQTLTGQYTNQAATPTNYLSVVINPTNGVMKVTFQPTGARGPVTGWGAVLQDQPAADGAFPGTNQSGAFLLK
jgi:hypothetical protein